MDVGHDFDGGVEHDRDTDHAAGRVGHTGPAASTGALARLLGLFGVGKVPLSILILGACFLWGAVGLALNVWLGTTNMLRVSGLAALAAVLGTRLLAEGLAALMPGEESYYTTREELVGLAGEVLYQVTPTSGTVRPRDPTGNLLDLDCRIHSGDGIQSAQRVVLDEYDSAADVFFVHMCNRVSLRTFKLQIDRTGPDALITADFLRADVKAVFYVRVQKEEKTIEQTATSLGAILGDARSVQNLIQEKLVSALRTVAATQTLHALNAERAEFAEAVQKIVAEDLKPNGLTLESVTISSLDQAPLESMRPEENVFDPEGARTIAEKVQSQRVARNTIQREADQKVKEQDVRTTQYLAQRSARRPPSRSRRSRSSSPRSAKRRRRSLPSRPRWSSRRSSGRWKPMWPPTPR